MIRIMLVDDSSFMRKLTKNMIVEDKELIVVEEAKNGEEAIEKINDEIDVVLLDIEMPKMTGLEVLEHLNKRRKMPATIMFSSLTKKGAEETIKALDLGAFDFIEKPNNPVLLNQKKDEIIGKIKSAASQNRRRTTIIKKPVEKQKRVEIEYSSVNSEVKNLILIGCSTGGPKALKEIIPMFPGNLDAAILVVQHMPSGGYTKSLSETLDRESSLKVTEAKNGQKIENGNVYIAPGGYQMKINGSGNIVITEDEPESGHAPSVDYMFREVLKKKGKLKLFPVVLTGMGGDGSKSSLIMSQNGIETIVESENTCVVFGMPKKVIEIGSKHQICDLEKIPSVLLKKLRN